MSAFLSGIAVGFAVAMPVGPIGVLCIKRSLKGGFGSGLATGLGAATADASYGLLAALGLAFSGLLAYAEPLKIGGGGLIILLGLAGLRAFFRPPPQAELARSGGGVLAAGLSTYLLTLANPATILAFIGLIAALGSASKTGPYVLVAGVFIGSLLWWLLLVSGVSLLKSRLPMATLRWLDLVSGTVLLAWGLWIILATLRAG